MSESIKTIGFISAAALMALAAVGSNFMNRPTNSSEFELVGQPFFEAFESAAQAQSLEVVVVDKDSAKLKRFSVESQNGTWRIPSQYNYPAEAADRLASTASSVIGIQRDSLAGRLVNEHERLGVVDPLGDQVEDPESIGQRLTLKDAAGDVVVDYIIGKQAGDVFVPTAENPYPPEDAPVGEKYYYVRRADEQQTYKVAMSIDLSTKFTDWIDPDLLKVNANEVTKIFVDNYTMIADRSTNSLIKTKGEKIDISRTSSTEPWELLGLNSDFEELNNSKVTEILGILDEIEIAGVRPKFKHQDNLLLTSDLKFNSAAKFEQTPALQDAIMKMRTELAQKGFNLAGTAQELKLVSQNGDLYVGTEKGVVYTLHIGSPFEGDESSIEFDAGAAVKSDADSADEAAPNDEDSVTSDALTTAKNRYLMIRVEFDESLIYPALVTPVKPIEPTTPEGYEPAKTPTSPVPGVATTDDETPGPPPVDDPNERSAEFLAYDKAVVVYADQMIEFEVAKTRFEEESEIFANKVTAGELLVDELNQRFKDWYYVITGENLKTLQVKREDVVNKIEPPAEKPAAPGAPLDFPSLPGEGSEPKVPSDLQKMMDDFKKNQVGEPEQAGANPIQETAEPAEKPKSSDPKTSDPKTSDPKAEDAKPKKAEVSESEPVIPEPKKPDGKSSESESDADGKTDKTSPAVESADDDQLEKRAC
ncbi:MAG: hypothetical protein ACI814_001217 [Mariniblastus sp.]|jgi:hypothetical protein